MAYFDPVALKHGYAVTHQFKAAMLWRGAFAEDATLSFYEKLADTSGK